MNPMTETLEQLAKKTADQIGALSSYGPAIQSMERFILTALQQAVAALTAENERLRKESKRDGGWIDEWGACRVCDGEIPHGHTPNCDMLKEQMENHTLRAENVRLQRELDQAHAAGAAILSILKDLSLKYDFDGADQDTTEHAAWRALTTPTAGAELLERVRTAEAERDNLRERLKSINAYAALEGPKLVARAAQLEAERDGLGALVAALKDRVVESNYPRCHDCGANTACDETHHRTCKVEAVLNAVLAARSQTTATEKGEGK